jgi:hypothetical protein
MTKNLKEMGLPINLQLEDVIDSTKVYSSPKLKQDFIEAFRKSSSGQDIVEKISDLVLERKVVVPCYKSKGIFSLLKYKLFGEVEDKVIMALTNDANNKIYIFIDNHLSLIGTSSNEILVSTTLHELMHLSARLHIEKFISIAKPYLTEYYKNAFMGIFDLKTDQFSVDEVIKFLSKFEGNHISLVGKLGTYASILDNEFKNITNLSMNEFIKRITGMMTIIKIILYSFSTFLKVYRNYIYLFTPLMRSYELSFNKKNNVSTPFQELFAISEVICVLAELKSNDPKIKQLVHII